VVPLQKLLPALATLTGLLVGPAACQGLKPPALLEGMTPEPDELDMRTTPVVRAVQRAADSVVSIYLLDAANGDPRTAVEGQGSGVLVDESGLVITNWHVIAQTVAAPTRHRLQVRLRDDRHFEATVLSSSPEHDLALLQLALRGEVVQAVTAGRSDSLMIGETVIAIGNPQGQANTVTVGVLSAIDRGISVRTPDGQQRDYRGLLQTDAAINRGNSGGALLDITGKLIGINNAMANDAENIGFAIPVDTVKRVFEDVLLASDNLANVWLGFSVDDRAEGAIVDAVVPYGPAARVGIRRGDLVRSVFGRPVRSKLDFARAVATGRAGEPVPLTLERQGGALKLDPIAMSGIERELALRTGLLLDAVGAEDDQGLAQAATRAFYAGSGRRRVPLLPVVLRIREVAPDSPAADLGFQAGDVLLGTRVRDFFGYRALPLRSVEDLADRARYVAGGRLFVIVLRGEETLEGELDVRRL
jgi:S1-C subfamily serine protease